MTEAYLRGPEDRVNWIKSIPFILVHLSLLAVLVTGVRWIDVAVCVALYYVRMFFVTAGYHRYFSHRSYKMGRVMQFLMALGGTTCAQKGVLWWAAHHRHHHKYSDLPEDIHSPKRGFWWSHVGWILCDRYEDTRFDDIKDFAKYPELRLLNRFHLVPPVLLGVGVWLALGWSGLVVGFLLSTVLLWHGTFTVNSLAHVFGHRRFVTTDTSRNSLILALITCGEGWHNNHHHYQSTANQGFYWWEVDLSYYVLKAMSWVGLTRDLRTPAPAVLRRNLVSDGHHDVGLLGALPAKAAAIPAKARAMAEQIAEGTRSAGLEPTA